MIRPIACGVLGILACAGGTHAFEVRCRFVERIGNTDVVLSGNHIDVTPGIARNMRIQFGVFDDAAGAAPAGGLVGWSAGTLAVSGPVDNSDERRNPGRLSPWNFSQFPTANGNPPLPGGDPFTMLTEIDAGIGSQSPLWLCDPQGNVPPQPTPVVRGRNTFISVYAFQIQPRSAAPVNYTVTAGGFVQSTSAWNIVGTPQPPDCGDPNDPSDDIPGSITYAPAIGIPQSFTSVLVVHTNPAPTSGVFLLMSASTLACRRRRAGT